MIVQLPARRPMLVGVTVVGLVIYLGLAIHWSADHLMVGLKALGAPGVCAVLGLSALNYGLRFWRWQWYLRLLGHEVPAFRHALYYFGGFAFTVTPGKAGEAVRALYLMRHQVPVTKVFAALFVERALDLLAICLLAAACVGSVAGYRGAALGLGAMVLLMSLLLGRPQLVRLLDARAERAGPRLRNALLGISRAMLASRQLLAVSKLYPGLLLGVLAWGAEGLGLWILAQAFDVSLSVQLAVAIYAIGVLGGALSFFMPGGLGGMEAAMTGLLIKLGGANLGVAGAITLLCRFATLWFAVVLGLAALVILELLPHSRPPAPLLRNEQAAPT